MTTAAAFLAALSGGEPIEMSVAVVVAHPDDETIGCGATLARLSNATLFHVTDGAPRDLADARRHGFADAASYAAARRAELSAAAALAGVTDERLVGLGFPDQGAALALVELAHCLRQRLAGFAIVLTHAYEGGHPDHDATAFAVATACRMMRPGDAPAIVEMPFYHAGPEGWRVQRFLPDPAASETVLTLQPEDRMRKAAMLAAFHSQARTLGLFDLDRERFRAAPMHDFAVLPNGGSLLYERHGWGLTGERWLDLVREASAELGSREAVS